MLRYRTVTAPKPECDAALAAFREFAAKRRAIDLLGARAVADLERTGAHFTASASSVAHFAEMNGLSAYEARELLNVNWALVAEPDLEAEILCGAVPIASAAVLGRIAADPTLVQPDDQWRAWARSTSSRDLRRRYHQRVDEVRAGERVITVTAYVTHPVHKNLARAQSLTSRTVHQSLTIGQTLGIVVSDWLDTHDPLRTTPGTRRLPDTSTLPNDRYVAAQVDRAVRKRSGDRCIVPFCDSDTWVHRSHRIPHRDGSDREAGNLDLLCDYHHALYEKGLLRISGPADKPSFTDRDGRPIGERHEFPGAGDPAKESPPATGSSGSSKLEGEPPGSAAVGSEPRPDRPPDTPPPTDVRESGSSSRRPPSAINCAGPPIRPRGRQGPRESLGSSE